MGTSKTPPAAQDRDLPARYAGCNQLDLGWSGGVLSVGLNRPRKRNAIGVEMTLEIERTLLAAETDAELRVIVLHGVGENFSAGMDMKDFFDHTDRDPAVLRRARAATDNWRARVLRRLPQTVITAVRGYCLGGALPLLECADVVLASGDAVFGMPEINFGFVPGGPIAKSLRSAVTVRAASYAALSGRPFDANQARKWGLVTHVVEHGDPYDDALVLAQHVARTGNGFPVGAHTADDIPFAARTAGDIPYAAFTSDSIPFAARTAVDDANSNDRNHNREKP